MKVVHETCTIWLARRVVGDCVVERIYELEDIAWDWVDEVEQTEESNVIEMAISWDGDKWVVNI